MDVNRCVHLHNEILQIGWEGRGNNASDLGKSWFEYYIDDVAEVQDRLSADVLLFLKRAHEVGDEHSFFYYVAGLSHPSIMFSGEAEENSTDASSRYLTLYAANDIAAHPHGLIYDQQTHTAIIQMTIEDAFTTRNRRQTWYPLATVLEAWRDMIRAGKIQAVRDDVEVSNLKFDPWIMVPYSASMLQETIQAFDHLVEAIEARMPNDTVPSRDSRPIGLADVNELQMSRFPAGFGYEFIRRVKHPSFRFVAPGLMIPTGTTLSDQPFFAIAPEPQNSEDGDILGIQPILLFRSEHHYTAPPTSDITGSNLPFSWPYNQVLRYPSGLYLAPVDRESSSVFEDECKLVLPFGIGGHGFARMSDGARFGENTEDKRVEPGDTFADLYQPGYQPFSEIHGVRLVKVLRSWTKMVEKGDWRIDGQGVVGDMNEWRKDDTEHSWNKYVVPVDW